jgi:hypothetical protein
MDSLPTIDLGATFTWRNSWASIPASAGWVATLYLNPRTGGTARTVAATASGDDFIFSATSTTTATWSAGAYAWEVWADLGALRVRADGGQVDLRATLLSAAAGTDTRTQAEIALEQARAALAAWTPTTRSYTIGGRNMQFNSAAEILQVISYWQVEIKREQAAQRMAAGLSPRLKIHVRTGRA